MPLYPKIVQYQWETDCTDITDEQRLQVCDWLRGHGLDPNETTRVAVILHGDRQRRIHITEYSLTDDGSRYADAASGDIVTHPRFVLLRTDPPIPCPACTVGRKHAVQCGNKPHWVDR